VIIYLHHNTLDSENLATFKYSETTVTNQNYTYKEIMSRLNCGNACYHSVQNLLCACVLVSFLKANPVLTGVKLGLPNYIKGTT